jgi:type VII secretion-associated protein (TIGR03931 family)
VNRVAVSAGSAWVRVAVDDPRPRLLAELPVAEGDASGVLAAELTALLDRPAEELIVVHGAGLPPAVPPAAAAVVRVVPAAVAALGCHPADTADAAAVPTDVVVVDAGRSGTDVVRVSGGRVVTACRVPVGGTVLDDVTAGLLGVRGTVDPAGAQAVREALSLLPVVRGGEPPAADLGADAVRCALAPPLAAVVAAVRTVVDGAGPGRSPPVLLIGGVARTPLLAELLDAAGVPDVRVAERPDAAAVVGALRLPAHVLGPPLTSGPTARSVTGSQAAFPGSPLLGPPSLESPLDTRAARAAAPTAYWLPTVAPARHRPLRALAAGAVAAVALAGLYAVDSALPAAGPVPLTAAGDLVQYGYAVRIPVEWAHSGGLPERRRSLLTPAGAPDGSDLISVERTPLGYDADAEPQRGHAELRAEFDRAVAGGAPLAGFEGDARFAGRTVVTYRETARGPDPAELDRAEVDWYVVLDGDAQLSVGCRHTAAGAARVAAACATVVDSLHRTT